jgi:hypothetical protein
MIIKPGDMLCVLRTADVWRLKHGTLESTIINRDTLLLLIARNPKLLDWHVGYCATHPDNEFFFVMVNSGRHAGRIGYVIRKNVKVIR